MESWYSTLIRPPLTPPDWVFGPVWTVLYLMIGVSVALYVRAPVRQHAMLTGVLCGIHAIANVSWTPLFFRLQSPGWALADILLLDVTLVPVVCLFWRAAPISGILLLPYAAWVAFATYLNAGFVVLN